MDRQTIKSLTKKLARINLKVYKSLSEIKADFDSVAAELIELQLGKEVTDTLSEASVFFNLLNEDDFNTNDQNCINEAKAVISKFTRVLNTLLNKWRTIIK
ncbi:MAG: hypothetical protein IPL31_05825 [Saprospiraceae bacterium]|nr:hypothetical protein [Saprospiraceae bacterium]